MSFTYTARHLLSGQFAGVNRSDGASIAVGGCGWDEFLLWNQTAQPPVSLADIIPDVNLERDRARAEAKALALIKGGRNVQLRAILKLLLDQQNIERQYLASIRAQIVALGGTLAAAPPTRTYEQLRTALENMIDNGDGDAP